MGGVTSHSPRTTSSVSNALLSRTIVAMAGSCCLLAYGQSRDVDDATQPQPIKRMLAVRSAHPTPEWVDKVAAAVRPNILFPSSEKVEGNPAAEFDVRLGWDGLITEQTLTKSSGLPEWDAAVSAALTKTARLPLDASGNVPPRVVITFRPKR